MNSVNAATAAKSGRRTGVEMDSNVRVTKKATPSVCSERWPGIGMSGVTAVGEEKLGNVSISLARVGSEDGRQVTRGQRTEYRRQVWGFGVKKREGCSLLGKGEIYRLS